MNSDSSPWSEEEVASIDALSDSRPARDRDGVASLRDTEAESGDESELVDLFDLDEREARALGVDLDGETHEEPGLD